MNLEFSEEQNVLREMVRGLCREYAPLELVRAMEDDPTGYPAEFWKQLGALGLLGLLIPEAYGGAEQSLLEAAIVYEELGRALAPSPHFVSAVMSAGVLREAGSEPQKQAWLPAIASGDCILTPAWYEPGGGHGPGGGALRAEPGAGGFRVAGRKRHVRCASSAARLLVLARSGGAPRDVSLFLVDPKAPGVGLVQQRSLASDTQYQVELDGVRVTAADRIGAAGSGWASWDRV